METDGQDILSTVSKLAHAQVHLGRLSFGGTFCLKYAPEHLACAIIYLAGKECHEQMPRDTAGRVWWEIVPMAPGKGRITSDYLQGEPKIVAPDCDGD